MTSLSNTEWAVARCLPDGLQNKEIARRLNMAEATVKVHLKAIAKKLEVKNRVQIAIFIDRQNRDASGVKGQQS